jgi:CBS domain containing-hemolysin-like protein
MLDSKTTVKDYMDSTPSKSFSRIPVYDDDKDNVIGIVLKDDMLDCMANNKGSTKLGEILHEVGVERDNTPLLQVFKHMTKSRQHLYIVKDEFGTLVGLVSMEDLFETLLGHEIIDESDKVVDLQEYARQKFEDKN